MKNKKRVLLIAVVLLILLAIAIGGIFYYFKFIRVPNYIVSNTTTFNTDSGYSLIDTLEDEDFRYLGYSKDDSTKLIKVNNSYEVLYEKELENKVERIEELEDYLVIFFEYNPFNDSKNPLVILKLYSKESGELIHESTSGLGFGGLYRSRMFDLSNYMTIHNGILYYTSYYYRQLYINRIDLSTLQTLERISFTGREGRYDYDFTFTENGMLFSVKGDQYSYINVYDKDQQQLAYQYYDTIEYQSFDGIRQNITGKNQSFRVINNFNFEGNIAYIYEYQDEFFGEKINKLKALDLNSFKFVWEKDLGKNFLNELYSSVKSHVIYQDSEIIKLYNNDYVWNINKENGDFENTEIKDFYPIYITYNDKYKIVSTFDNRDILAFETTNQKDFQNDFIFKNGYIIEETQDKYYIHNFNLEYLYELDKSEIEDLFPISESRYLVRTGSKLSIYRIDNGNHVLDMTIEDFNSDSNITKFKEDENGFEVETENSVYFISK